MKQAVMSDFGKLLVSLLGLSLALGAQTGASGAAEQSIAAALRAHHFSEAYELSRSAVAESPRNPKLLALQAYALVGLGRSSDALNAYNRALSVSPEYLPALEGAAQLEYDAGTKRAEVLLDRILELRPGEPTAHAMLAVIDYRRHDCTSALKHFAAARPVISSQPAALAEYGSCLLDQDQPQAAIPLFQQVLAEDPEDSRARYNLAVVELAANQGKDALAILQPLVDSAQPDPDVLDLASSAYEQAGDTPNAVRLLRQAIVLDPKKLKYYVDFATISFTHQSFQVGVDMMNAGLEANPKAAQLYVARGVLYIQLAQYDKGEADFATANRLDPRESSGAIAEGLAQMQQSNLDQALATVHSQLKSHSEDAFLHYLEGQILFQRGGDPGTPDFKQAIQAAELSQKLRPDFELVHDLLGNLYLKSGQMERSMEQSRLALKQNPADQEALYHLIQALRESHKDTKGELPALVKRLAELRQDARNSEASSNRYKLYEPSAP